MDNTELYELARDAKSYANKDREKAEEAQAYYLKILESEPNSWEPLFYSHYFNIFLINKNKVKRMTEMLQLFINDLPAIVKQACNPIDTDEKKHEILLSLSLDLNTISSKTLGYITADVQSVEDAEHVGKIISALVQLHKVCADSIGDIYGEIFSKDLQYYSRNQIQWLLNMGSAYRRWIPNYDRLYEYASLNLEKDERLKKNTSDKAFNKRGCAAILICLIGLSVTFSFLFMVI